MFWTFDFCSDFGIIAYRYGMRYMEWVTKEAPKCKHRTCLGFIYTLDTLTEGNFAEYFNSFVNETKLPYVAKSTRWIFLPFGMLSELCCVSVF